ncbi:MAG TPA: protein phosphatase 2C domain-containing protein [Pseudonocardia sp.]
MALLEATADQFGELRMSLPGRHQQRQVWDQAIDRAVNNPALGWSPLRALWLVAGWSEPMTAAELSPRFAGELDWWRRTLEGWVELGALERDPSGTSAAPVYRTTASLRELWRAAGPGLRRALTADPTALPGGAALHPLLGTEFATPLGPDARVAYRALRRLMSAGAMVRHNWRDGWLDDAGSVRRSVTGVAPRTVNRGSRVNPYPSYHRPWPAMFALRWLRTEIAASAGRAWVPRRHAVTLFRRLGRVNAAVRAHRRWRLTPVWRRGPDWMERGQRLVSELATAQGALAEAVADARAALNRADVYPHKVESTLRAARAALGEAAGTDQAPPNASENLAAARVALRAAVDRLNSASAASSATEVAEALRDARDAQRQYATADANGWRAGLDRTTLGWRSVRRAARASRELRRTVYRTRQRFPAVTAAPSARTLTSGGQDITGAAGRTVADPSGDNQDRFELRPVPGGVVVTAADGLGNTPDAEAAAELAARVGADVAAALLADPATDPATVTERAYRAVADAIASQLGWGADSTNWAPGEDRRAAWPHAPGTTFLSALVLANPRGPGTVVFIGWVGDSRLYWLPLPSPGTGGGEQLTEDHSRAGTMTRWVAPDHRPELNNDARRPDQPYLITGPGLLVMATDGLWEQLPGPADLASVLSDADYTDPAAAADKLIAAALAKGSDDDTTVVVVQLDGNGRPVSGAAPGTHRPHPGPLGERDTDTELLATELPRWLGRTRTLTEAERSALAGWDGDPSVVRVLPAEVLAELAGTPLGAALAGVFGFGWPDPTAPGGGVVMVLEPALAKAIALSTGPLADDWLARALDHEVGFHLVGRPGDHDADAEALLAELARARRGGRPARLGRPLVGEQWEPADTELLLRVLPWLTEAMLPAAEVSDLLPRGPPAGWVLDEEQAIVALADRVLAGEFGLAEVGRVLSALGRMWTFAWHDPDVPRAAGGAVLSARWPVDQVHLRVAYNEIGAGQARYAWGRAWRGAGDSDGDSDGAAEAALDRLHRAAGQSASEPRRVLDRYRRLVQQLLSSRLHPDDYRPSTLVFRGDGPVFLGLELEVYVSTLTAMRAAEVATGALGGLGYLVSDGSITPVFEIVTHPMSYRWAMDNFPFGLLTALAALGARTDRRAGLHVHVSRAGFASHRHIEHWMRLVYDNEVAVTALARRRSAQYAKFTAEARANLAYYALGGRDADREQAINVQNRDTFELRIFAGTLDGQQLRAALGFVAASVEYTRSLSEADVRSGALDWARFAAWVARFTPLRRRYPDLAARGPPDVPRDPLAGVRPTYRDLRALGLRDAHHVIQDKAVDELPGYRREDAPAVQLDGPATRRGSPHYRATQVQREPGGGTYRAERAIALRALRAAGVPREAAWAIIERADTYFLDVLGVDLDTATKIPGNRHR